MVYEWNLRIKCIAVFQLHGANVLLVEELRWCLFMKVLTRLNSYYNQELCPQIRAHYVHSVPRVTRHKYTALINKCNQLFEPKTSILSLHNDIPKRINPNTCARGSRVFTAQGRRSHLCMIIRNLIKIGPVLSAAMGKLAAEIVVRMTRTGSIFS